MGDELEQIVQRMIDAGESEDNIALVIREFPQQQEPKSITGFLRNIPDSLAETATGIVSLLNPATWAAAADQKRAVEDEAVQQVMSGPITMSAPSLDHLKSELSELGNEAYRNPVGMAMSAFSGRNPTVSAAPIKGTLVRGGVRAMRGAIKPNTGDLNKMAGSTQAGLDAMSEKVATTALRERVNPMTGRGLETVQRRVDDLNQARDAAIAAAPQAPVPGSGWSQLSSLRPVAQRYRNQSTPEADVQSVVGIGREMARNPGLTTARGGNTRSMRDLTPNELNTFNKGDNRALAGKFGKVGDAEIDARKAVVGARRDMLDQAVPGTRDMGKRLSELIDLRNVANVARKRGEGRDLLGLTDLIALTSQQPAAFLATTAMRPAAQAGMAGMLYRTGQAIPDGVNLGHLLRAALLEQLTGEAPQP